MRRSGGSVLSGTASTALAIGIGQALNAIAFLAMARRLGPSEFGAFAAIYATSLFVGAVLDFGSSQRQARELARGENLASFSSWLLARTLLQFPLTVIAGLVGVTVLRDQASAPVVLLLAGQALTMTLAQGVLSGVRAIRSPQLSAWQMAAGNSLLLLASLLGPSGSLMPLCAGAAALSWLFSGLLGWTSLRAALPRRRLSYRGNPWNGSLSFGVFGLAVLLQGLSIALVGAFAGAASAGELAAVSKWTQPIVLVVGAYASFSFPSLSAAPSDRDAIRSMAPATWLLGVACFVSATIVVLAPQLVTIGLGPGYEASVGLLRLSVLATLPVLVGQPLAGLLQARDQESHVAITTLVVTVMGLILTAALAAPVGAAAAPVASGVVSLTLSLLFAARAFKLWRSDHRGDRSESLGEPNLA